MALVLEDTFTGSGALNAHTADTGQTWTTATLYGSPGVVLGGATLLTEATYAAIQGVPDLDASPLGSDDLAAEADVTILVDSNTDGGAVTLVWGDVGTPEPPTNGAVLIFATSGFGSTVLYLNVYRGGALEDSDLVTINNPVALGTFVPRLEVNAARTEFIAKVDGVTKLTLNTAAVTGDLAFSFEAQLRKRTGAYRETLDAVRVYVGPAPPANDPPVVSSSAPFVALGSTDNPLGLTAPTDTDGDDMTITVTALPARGAVHLDGVAVTGGQVLTGAELEALLYDAPTLHGGANPVTFTYDVDDGTDTATGTATITISEFWTDFALSHELP